MARDRIIKTRRDVKFYLDQGYTPLETSLIHWKQNVELMENDNFNIEVHDKTCALCATYGSSRCLGCPLDKMGYNCNNENSLWKKINKAMEDWHEHWAEGVDVSLRGKQKEYELKGIILDRSLIMVQLLEEALREEKSKNRTFGRKIYYHIVFKDGTEKDIPLWEMNNTGFYLPTDDFDIHFSWDYERIKYIEVGGQLIWGSKEESKNKYLQNLYETHSTRVSSSSEVGKTYEITWKEDKETGEEFDGKCSCPAFKFGTTRPCKHIKSVGLEFTVSEEDRIHKKRSWDF